MPGGDFGLCLNHTFLLAGCGLPTGQSPGLGPPLVSAFHPPPAVSLTAWDPVGSGWVPCVLQGPGQVPGPSLHPCQLLYCTCSLWFLLLLNVCMCSALPMCCSPWGWRDWGSCCSECLGVTWECLGSQIPPQSGLLGPSPLLEPRIQPRSPVSCPAPREGMTFLSASLSCWVGAFVVSKGSPAPCS